MNRNLVTWLVVVSGVLASGCAADELEAREAAYPEPVGYTPPNARRTAFVPTSPTQQAARPEEAAPPVAETEVGETEEEGTAEGALPPVDPEAEGLPSAEASDGYADADPAALQDFRPALDPYGTWTDDPTYGTVWVPSPSVVGDDFAPYTTAGHWAYDNDYVWVSDYDWGWAPFHYGRWAYAGGVGWEWIPGRRYAGAWVSWRYGAPGWDYVGWAPLAPTWCWHRGEAVGLGFVPRAPYAFVGTGDLFGPSLRGRLVAGSSVTTIAANTRPWVRATPAVVGGPEPRLGFRGPPPAALHLSSAALPRPPADDRGLIQARAFARPATAVALGARGPMAGGAATWQAERWRGASTVSAGGRVEANPPSHFGGRFGAGFAGSPAVARPVVYAPSAVPYSSRAAVANRSDFPVRSIPFRGAFEGNGGGAPAVRAPYVVAPAVRAPYGGAPAVRAPYSSAPVVGGAYAGVSRPAVAPASPPAVSPSISSGARSSFGNYSAGAPVHAGGGFSGGGFPQGGGFRGGGGGGFHGGGGRR